MSEKEIEINLYNYLERIKINNENINSFYNQNEIEKDYLKNIIKIDMKWSKLVKQLYESRLNVNLTEVNKVCLLYTSPSPRDRTRYRMPSSA